MTWTQSGEFVESDVVEWTEAVWPPNHRRRRSKPRPWGKQKVIAQITAIEGEFIKLIVLRSEVIENLSVKELRPHKVGVTITKKTATLLRGEPRRLLWSEEEVRVALLNQSSEI
jgi:hypothetical protein